MNMAAVKSSNISKAGYENGTMRIQFSNGTQYDYKGVSPQIFDDFISAKSQGRYYHTVIRARFTGTKVAEEKENG